MEEKEFFNKIKNIIKDLRIQSKILTTIKIDEISQNKKFIFKDENTTKTKYNQLLDNKKEFRLERENLEYYFSNLNNYTPINKFTQKIHKSIKNMFINYHMIENELNFFKLINENVIIFSSENLKKIHNAIANKVKIFLDQKKDFDTIKKNLSQFFQNKVGYIIDITQEKHTFRKILDEIIFFYEKLSNKYGDETITYETKIFYENIDNFDEHPLPEPPIQDLTIKNISLPIPPFENSNHEILPPTTIDKFDNKETTTYTPPPVTPITKKKKEIYKNLINDIKKIQDDYIISINHILGHLKINSEVFSLKSGGVKKSKKTKTKKPIRKISKKSKKTKNFKKI